VTALGSETRSPSDGPGGAGGTGSRRTLTAILSALVILILWQVVAQVWLERLAVLASPTSIVRSLVVDWSSLYAGAFASTAWAAARGWFWGNLAAIVIAVLFVRFRSVENLLLRLAVTLFCLPLVAVMPILQLTFDSDQSRVALAALSVFFTTLVSTVLGLRAAEGGSLTMIRAWGGGLFSGMRYVRFRSAIPSLVTGLQIGAAAAVLGAIFGEFVGSTSGLGVILINGMMSIEPARIWSVAVLATAMAAVPYALLGIGARYSNRWSNGLVSAGSGAGPASTSPLRAIGATLGWALGSCAVIVAAWYGYLRFFHIVAFVGKTPLDVVQYLFAGSSSAANRAPIFQALGVTLLHAGVGYIVGILFGVGIAILFVSRPALEVAFSPLTIALRSVPIIVMTPLLVLVFGRGIVGVAVITTIVTFFPTLANITTGLRRTPTDAMVLMRSYDSSASSLLWRVRLPFAMPSIFASARIAAPAAVLAATLAEWQATGDGLGYLIDTAKSESNFVELWAGAAVLTVVSLIFYSIVSAFERLALRRYAPDQLR
jgi:sulfonate transport system permease protein